MMKKALFILGMLMVVLSLTACTTSQFDGSRILNDDQFMLEYKAFNGTDSHVLKLEEGDRLSFDIISEAGKLSVDVQMGDEAAIYRGADMPTSIFTVVVPTSGEYKVTVKAENAKGRLNIIKEAE